MVREGVAGMAIGMDLPVASGFGQFLRERDGGLRRSDRVVPAMADQQPRGDLRMGEGRRVVDAVEADAACNLSSGTGKVQHAFARSEESRVGKECVNTCSYRCTPYP